MLPARFAGDVERERLVRLFRSVLGDLFPEIVLGHRCDVAERPGALNGTVDSRLRDEGMSPAGGAAFGGIGLEGRSRPGPMRQGIDVLALGAHALRGVDCEGVAEAEQEPPGLRVREPLPVDLGRLAARVAQDESGSRPSDYLDDVAVVADRGALAVDLGGGFAVHAQPISGRDGQVEEF